MELAKSGRARPHCPFARCQKNPKCFVLATAARRCRFVIGEGFTGGADSIQLIRLAFLSAWSARPLDLDDSLPVLLQEDGESGTVTSGSLHRPDSTANCVVIDVAQERPVSGGAGTRLEAHDDSSGGANNGGAVRLLLSVDHR